MSHLPSFPGSSSHRPSRARRQSWRAFRKKSPHPIFVPLLFIDWTAARAAGIILDNADLTGANITNLADWQSIQSIKQANIHALKNAPDGFILWALRHGAIDAAPAINKQ